MQHDATKALYRAHATARLRGDEVEARRLAERFGPVENSAHLLFTLHLMTAVVFGEFGTRPDPADLAELTERLHGKHYREGGAFIAIRAEAMIRTCCGEAQLITEIPFSEQSGYMWAVIAELVDPGITDAELAERFAMAEELAEGAVDRAFVQLRPGVPFPAGSHAPQREHVPGESGGAAPAVPPAPRGERAPERPGGAAPAVPPAPGGERSPGDSGSTAPSAPSAPQGERAPEEFGSAVPPARTPADEAGGGEAVHDRETELPASPTPVVPSEPAGLAEPAEPSEPADPTTSTGSAEPAEPSGPPKPAGPTGTAEPAGSVEPTASAAPLEPTASDRTPPPENTAPSRIDKEPTP